MANRAQRRAMAKTSPLAAVPDKPQKQYKGVVIAYPHPVGEVGARFHVSMVDLLVRDAYTAHHVVGHLPMSSGANIVTARNKMVAMFLEQTNGEWFWSIDADMAFKEDTLDRLLAATKWSERDEKHYVEQNGKPSGVPLGKFVRPIIGGLCFALMKGEAQEIVPTLYGFSTAQQMVRYNGFPEDRVVQVVGTGMACLLIHRSVFEGIRNFELDGEKIFTPPWPWFAETVTGTNWGDAVSEDLTFCLRAAQAGFPVHVDTSIEIRHVKPMEIGREEFYKALPSEEEPAPTYVTIPCKGHQEMTMALLDQLQEQGQYDQIFIFDNADRDEDKLVGSWKNTTIIPAAGKSVYQMWNMGIRQSINTATRCNVVILNNDLILEPDFLAALTKGLRAHPSIASVSANYDNRDFPEDVQAVKGIAAGREDGTGGWAGFAFAIRGEIFQAGCPMFDEAYRIWYGDNDFLNNLEKAGATYGIVREARCKHIGGGSNTSGDGKGHRLTPELAEAAEADRLAFEAKWSNR